MVVVSVLGVGYEKFLKQLLAVSFVKCMLKINISEIKICIISSFCCITRFVSETPIAICPLPSWGENEVTFLDV